MKQDAAPLTPGPLGMWRVNTAGIQVAARMRWRSRPGPLLTPVDRQGPRSGSSGRGPRASDLRSEVMEMEMFLLRKSRSWVNGRRVKAKGPERRSLACPGEGATVGADGGGKGTPSGFRGDTTEIPFWWQSQRGYSLTTTQSCVEVIYSHRRDSIWLSQPGGGVPN